MKYPHQAPNYDDDTFMMRCPHCSAEIDYVLDMQWVLRGTPYDEDGYDGDYKIYEIKEIGFHCPVCHEFIAETTEELWKIVKGGEEK